MKLVMMVIRWFMALFGMRQEPETTVPVASTLPVVVKRKRSITPCHVPLYASDNPPMGRVIPFHLIPHSRVPVFDDSDTEKDWTLPDTSA